ncbi:MAG: DNA-directed RNA polymerase subunit beta', partial [Treponema sp.]|nr:DNA-directed RNA polymerase subunit beta' [Treponema sp.]
MRDIQDFDSIMIRLASPEMIRSWSYGEVKKPETINYRTLRPEKEGLFCERIFGTTKEWECYCGKFKSIRYKGVICDRCGVEVTHFKVRRERMGHIELAAPVSHIWYYRSVPSRIGLLLDLPTNQLRSVLYYEKYIVIDSGDTPLKKGQLLTEDEFYVCHERYGGSFTAGMGAEAVSILLENLSLDTMASELRQKMIDKKDKCDKRLLKRIEIVENFRGSHNKPQWMILNVIPVIPPELRPMVQLDGGRFATSDLNDLYRRVINRNNRLKRLQSLTAPDIIIRNEKRMLQEAVDALFDNSKKKKVVKGSANRPLKSISDMLKGKQGRFRQNLLGKRVDYSGRSVITVGPDLKMWQCGIPTKMALELFKPFIMKKLVDKDVVFNIKKAKMLVEQETPEVFAILDEVVKEHPVLLNRAPTLHRLGIQAFEPVLVEGKAIKLHPLVCHAFNADFDGDQMAVHVPLTQAAQMECWTLMLSARNLLNPANGKTIVFPSQDMVLGINFLTRINVNAKRKGSDNPETKDRIPYYSSPEEVMMAVERKTLDWGAAIRLKPPKHPIWDRVGNSAELNASGTIVTTAGRLVFNEELPADLPFINFELKDKEIRSLVEYVFRDKGSWISVQMLDAVKHLGYLYATIFGATIGVDDIVIPKEKAEMIDEANKNVESIQKQWRAGHITNEERYNQVVQVWTKTNDNLTDKTMKTLESDRNGFNSIYMMANSG